MGTIVYFEENGSRKCVIRFVKEYREKGWFRKESIGYSLSSVESRPFLDVSNIEKVSERIQKDYPNANVYCTEYSEFWDKYKSHLFWVIVMSVEDGIDGYYSATMKNSVEWTYDIENAEISLDKENAEECVQRLRRQTGQRICSMPIYLNVVNGLLEPSFMIICKSKSGNEETKYLARIEGNRLRLVTTSDAARKYTYKELLETFEYLQSHNKNFFYASLPSFNDNVSCKDLEDYVRDKKLSRRIAVTTKLKWLNR